MNELYPYKVKSDETLKRYTKDELIDIIRVLEFNWLEANRINNIQTKRMNAMRDKLKELGLSDAEIRETVRIKELENI